MTQIAIGDVVRYRSSPIAYVARALDPYGRWLIVATRADRAGKSAFSCVQAGVGDLQVVVARPTLAPGTTLLHEGLTCSVDHDAGDWVVVNVPAHRHETRGGDGLNIPPSRVEVSKSDVVLDSL